MTPSNPVRPRRTIVRDSARPDPVQCKCASRECAKERRELEKKYRELNEAYWAEQRNHLERLDCLKVIDEENANMRKECARIEREMGGLRFELNNMRFNLEHARGVEEQLEAENRALVEENADLINQLTANEALTLEKLDYSSRLLREMFNTDRPLASYEFPKEETLPDICSVCLFNETGRFVFSFVCGPRHAICLDCFLKIVLAGKNLACPLCRAKYLPGELFTTVIESNDEKK